MLIREIGSRERDRLLEMYESFDPIGAAQGLPPQGEDARRDWIDAALRQELNVGAFSDDGQLIGHCFLAADEADSAELAVFVHQDFRRKGVGSKLVAEALKGGCAAGFRRVWTLTSSDNVSAIRMLGKSGFQVTNPRFPAVELQIELPPDCGQRRESRLLANVTRRVV